MVATLSRMLSRYFAEAKLREGQIVQLRAAHQPGWFEPLIKPGCVSKVLPLWRFTLRPTYGQDAEKKTCPSPRLPHGSIRPESRIDRTSSS